tara:strand:- start:917 stop:1315 length:399 start_codon:yes stop_codon:yes gene_type:complete
MNEQEAAGRIMAHAFNDELEKIAKVRPRYRASMRADAQAKALRRSAEHNFRQGTPAGKETGERMARAARRKERQARVFRGEEPRTHRNTASAEEARGVIDSWDFPTFHKKVPWSRESRRKTREKDRFLSGRF